MPNRFMPRWLAVLQLAALAIAHLCLALLVPGFRVVNLLPGCFYYRSDQIYRTPERKVVGIVDLLANLVYNTGLLLVHKFDFILRCR